MSRMRHSRILDSAPIHSLTKLPPQLSEDELNEVALFGERRSFAKDEPLFCAGFRGFEVPSLPPIPLIRNPKWDAAAACWLCSLADAAYFAILDQVELCVSLLFAIKTKTSPGFISGIERSSPVDESLMA